MDLIIKGAGYIVTLNENNNPQVLCDHALLIDNGKIVDIVPEADLPADIIAKKIHHYSKDMVLMPGLVNAHTHLGLTLLRGYADDLALSDWLNHHIWPVESRWLSHEFTTQGVELGIAELIRCGVTCVNDMYFFPEATAKVCQRAGLRAFVSIHCIEFENNYTKNVEEGLSKGEATRQEYENDLIQFTYAPHAPYTVPESQLINIIKRAQNENRRVHIHLHETKEECDHSEQGIVSPQRHLSDARMRPLANLQKLGLLSENLIGVHMTQLTTQEIDWVAQSGMHAVHCPHSNLKLASGFSPIASMVDNGINVALGTDSSASNNALDMVSEMKTAAIMAKAVANDPRAIPALQALKMATLNGAKALGIADDTGSLEKNKSADFIAIHLDSLESVPLYDLLSHLVYCTDRHMVKDVWVQGKPLMLDRQLLTLNEQQIVQKTKAWAVRIKKQTQQPA